MFEGGFFMENKTKFRWATLGVGVIGHQLADAMQALGGGLYAVGNRTHETAVTFAADMLIPLYFPLSEISLLL